MTTPTIRLILGAAVLLLELAGCAALWHRDH